MISFQVITLSMYLDGILGIKHLTWLCQVDYKVYFVVFKLLNEINPHTTRFFVILTPFSFLYSTIIFLNQGNLLIAYSLSAQAHLQSVLHQARYGSDHFLS